MDLPKAFDCILHGLLVTKRYYYGLSIDGITFIYSYLKIKKQGLNINDTESPWRIILSGVPQGSILDLISFNISISHLLLFIN